MGSSGQLARAGHCDGYDAFGRGRFPVGVASIRAFDMARDRGFPCEIWYPAEPRHQGQDLAPDTSDRFTVPHQDRSRTQAAVRDAAPRPGNYALILYSHSSGGHRRSATFLSTHLASHGYVVAALDHSERVAGELAPQPGETAAQRAARVAAWIANRVPDIRFLLDQMVTRRAWKTAAVVDPNRVGIVGHSFGGWTALATPDTEPRIGAVVALAPGGSSRPRPGIIAATLAFGWSRDVPTLYLAGDRDVFTPLPGIYELFDRTPATRHMVILHRADHQHFNDDVAYEHEVLRAMSFPPEAAWIQQAIRPIAELCSAEHAHLTVRGLTLSHLDAALRQQSEARRLLAGDIAALLASLGVEVIQPRP